jgi:hypothetical protein
VEVRIHREAKFESSQEVHNIREGKHESNKQVTAKVLIQYCLLVLY